MPAKLSDSQFIERTRQQNRERAERQRQRLLNSGKTALTVWIPATLRTALNALASERGATIADTAAELLSTALECEPATPVTAVSTDTSERAAEPDTLDWIAALTPVSELMADINATPDSAPGTPEPASPEPESAPSHLVSVRHDKRAIVGIINELLDAGLSGGEIARRLNADGWRTATGKEFQRQNIMRDYRKWKAEISK